MFRYFLIVSSLFFSLSLSADEYIYCNTCVTFSDFENSAKSQLILKNKFIGKIYVGNPTLGTAMGMKVEKTEYRPPGFVDDRSIRNIHQLVVYRIPVSQEFLDLVKRLKTEISFFILDKVVVPSDSGLTSAWDIAQNNQNRGRLDVWFEENHPVDFWFTQASSILGGVFGQFSPFSQIERVFVFSDGSKVIMKATSLQATKLAFSYIPGTSEDIDGNIIPDNVFSMSGSMEFSNENNMNDFFEKARQYGIPIQGIVDCSHLCKVVITDL